jgi:HEAT repeat protein
MTHDAREATRRARDPDEEVRYRAIRGLPDPAASVPLLLECLGDESWRVRKAAVEQIVALADPRPAIPGLLAALAIADGAGARNSAAEALAQIGAPAVQALVERLSHPDPDLRKFAIDVLGEIGERRTVPDLVARLTDGDPNVRASAAEAIGKVGGEESVAALTTALDSDDQLLRLAALEGLGQLRQVPPVARLQPLMADRFLRRLIYRLLGRSDEPEAYPLLVAGVLDPARGTREAALAAIGEQCRRRPAGALAELVVRIRAAQREPILAATCQGAIRACEPGAGAGVGAPETEGPGRGADVLAAQGGLAVLGWLGDARRAAVIAEAAEDERLRPAAVEALLNLGPAVGEPLRAALSDLSSAARAAILTVFAKLDDPAGYDLLKAAAEDEDPDLRGAAIEGLGQLGDARAVPLLVGQLCSSDEQAAAAALDALSMIAATLPGGRESIQRECRAWVVPEAPGALYRALGMVGTPEDLPALRRGARSTAASVRRAAIEGLGALGLKEAVESLRIALADEDAGVRSAAATALGQLVRRWNEGPATSSQGRDEAVRVLTASLRDGEPQVRASVAEALGRCGARSSCGAIAELMQGPETFPAVAIAVLRALTALRHADAATLLKAAQHPDAEVVKEAVMAAADLADPAAVEILASGLRHRRWDVRRVAARAVAVRGDATLFDDLRSAASVESDAMAGEAFAEALRVLRRS